LKRNRVVALRGGIVLEVTEAGGGVANLRMASGRRLAYLKRRTTGKHSHSEFKMRLNALSVALQDVAEASHPSPEILNVVEARH